MASSDQKLKVRVLAAIPRSGSTLLMRLFREVPDCAVTSRLILMGRHDPQKVFLPDHRVFENPTELHVYREALEAGYSTLITKEELGHEIKKGECTYAMFPNVEAYKMTKPVFLFRDPVRVFDSWMKLRWTEIPSMIQSYRNLYQMWKDAPEPKALIYERLVASPASELKPICDFWGVDYNEKMTSFAHEFGDFLFESQRETTIYTIDQPAGIFDSVKKFNTVEPLKSHGLITGEYITKVEQILGKLYLDAHGPLLDPLKALLKSKQVFAFDLDDTLHEFRKSSSAASLAVFERLATTHNSPIPALQDSYNQILASSTSAAFTDGKTSTEYRKARFAALCDASSIPHTPALLDELASLYKSALASALELKSGVLALLFALRDLGKTIAVVTEGPEDAQVWTIEQLGLAGVVHHVLTTNKLGVSKTDGLFAAALEQMGWAADEVVMVGDSYERDVVPAREQGILAVHYSERENVSFEVEELRVNTHWKLKGLMDG